MRHFVYILSFLLLVNEQAAAQLLPIRQPEQDACNALMLCGDKFYTPYSYQGRGYKMDLDNTPCSISGLKADEANSMWLRLEVATSGTLVFTITPVNPQDDYDWAVLSLVNGDCNHLSAADVVRCNFNRNVPVTNRGITGLSTTAVEHGVPANTQGHPYCRYIDARAGEVYLIMVNNFGYNGGISSGFTIDFSGSTATFNNPDPPHLDRIERPCTIEKSVSIKLTKSVTCASIAPDGSDFSLSGGNGIVTGASGINCNGMRGYTDEITVSFSGTLPPGTYTLHARKGTDNNTLLDLCHNELSLPDALPFVVPRLSTVEDIAICGKQLPFHWHGKTLQQGGRGVAQAHFTSVMGCDSVVTLNLSVEDTLKVTQQLSICPDQLPYRWNGIPIATGGRHIASYLTQSQAGCDSLTYLDLTVQYPEHKTYHLEGCWSVLFNHHRYDRSQTALDTIISSVGCDSVYATLYVTVHPPDTLTRVTNIAGCGSVSFQGKVYEKTITLRDTLSNQYGCDSVYDVTHITVYPNKYTTDNYYITRCDSVTFEGKTYDYDITLRDSFQNVLGCDSAIRITHIHPEHFQLGLTADPDSPAAGVYLHLSTHANAPYYQILAWLPADLFPQQGAWEQTIKVMQPGWVTYRAIGRSDEGCIDTAVMKIKIDTLVPKVFMPTAFSPNGDGLNDVFRPDFINRSGYEIETFKIFNRYGRLVYRSDRSANAGWNGRYANGQPAETGVYYYYIHVRFVDHTFIELKGDVTLIR